MSNRRGTYIFATDLNRRPGRGLLKGLLVLLICLLLAGFLVNYITGHQVNVEQLRVAVPSLPSDLESYSILHLSDLHGDSLGEDGMLLTNAVKNLSISCVVFSGDMLGQYGDTTALLQLVRALPESTPKLLLVGDEDVPYLDASAHDSLSPLSAWAEELTRAGVTILDEPVLFTRGRNGRSRIWFVPEYLYSLNLDSLEATYNGQLKHLNKSSLSADEAAQKRVAEYELARAARIRQSISEIQAGDVQIVVSHTPLTEAYAATLMNWRSKNELFSLRRASLILAGHYCAGQWRLPFLGPVYVEEKGWFPGDEGIVGMNWIGGIPQYISPGLGANHVCAWQPFRLFNSPGITRIVLSSSQ